MAGRRSKFVKESVRISNERVKEKINRKRKLKKY